MKGSTHMSESKQSLTVNDIPLVTVCLDTTNKNLKYEQDLNIKSYQFLTDKLHALTEEQNKMAGGNKINLKHLSQRTRYLETIVGV